MARRRALNSFRLCIDTINDSHWSGRVYSLLLKQKINFNDLTEMVLMVDQVFDHNDYPKAYQTKRSFNQDDSNKNNEKLKVKYDLDLFALKKGKLKTYDIIVTSRQHTSWQGIVKNEAGQIIKKFNSDLKLIEFLMQDYL